MEVVCEMSKTNRWKVSEILFFDVKALIWGA